MTPNAFYTQFDRHAHGKGLKGASTHYCPGCGHGLIQKMLAETISEFGIQDRTIAISPVGCAVFMYYYLDVGNSQAAHGRAPAVGLGHKMANPNSVVISYQGDGDLASIGLAEIISAAQLGVPMTVIFVNNAIYGMTGGQMAPTTLPGMKSTTSPYGREQIHGQPLKVAEMMATLDGPAYVERVALFDQKNRKRARKALQKAIRLQMEGKGFALVEVLSECPTHLGMTGEEAETWVEEVMTKHFPLGVLKDEERDAWFDPDPPTFVPETMAEVVGIQSERPERYATEFPTHIDPQDVSIKMAGAGGDGAQTVALLVAKSAIQEGFDATHIPSYGPESRGGTSYADVHVARDEVLSPASPTPNILVAFNAPSLDKFGPSVIPGGHIIYDSSVIEHLPEIDPSVHVHAVPCTEIAHHLGKRVIKNVVALGALQAATGLLPEESILAMMRKLLAHKCAMIPINEEAFAWGVRAIREEIKHFD